MVKVDAGGLSAMGSSVSTASNSRSQALNQALSSFAQFAGASDLKGKAYDSAKNYQASVLTPLLQGLIIYTEAVGNAASTLSSTYASLCGGESLDSDQLETEISNRETSLSAAQELSRKIAGDRTFSASSKLEVQVYINSLQSDLTKLREKLEKLNEFDRQSSTIVSNISALEGALKSGTAQVVADFNGFCATTGFPSYQSGSLDWVTSIQSNVQKQNIDFDNVQEKIIKGESLTITDVQVIQQYGVLHPSERASPLTIKALNQYSLSIGQTAILSEEDQKFSELIKFISTNLSVGTANFAGDIMGDSLAQPIEKYGTAYAMKQATEIFNNRYSTELWNGKIMGKVPGATQVAIEASNEAIMRPTSIFSNLVGESMSFIGGTAVGVGIDMWQGDSAEEAWGKEITTGIVSTVVVGGLALATAEITVPAVALYGVGVLVGTAVSYANEWATGRFPVLEEFEDSVGEGVVDSWNSMTSTISDLFGG